MDLRRRRRPARSFNTDAEANAYDCGLLTDADLVDVTNFNATRQVSNAAGRGPGHRARAGTSSTPPNDERTGSTGTLVNGCMIWGSFEPSGSAGAVCSTTGTNKARLYQSHFATGRANCASGFYSAGTNTWARYVEFTTVASTPEPVAQLTLAGGQLSRGVTIVGAGTSNPNGGGATGPFSIDVRTTNDAVKSLYQLELDRRAHDCRHEGIQRHATDGELEGGGARRGAAVGGLLQGAGSRPGTGTEARSARAGGSSPGAGRRAAEPEASRRGRRGARGAAPGGRRRAPRSSRWARTAKR